MSHRFGRDPSDAPPSNGRKHRRSRSQSTSRSRKRSRKRVMRASRLRRSQFGVTGVRKATMRRRWDPDKKRRKAKAPVPVRAKVAAPVSYASWSESDLKSKRSKPKVRPVRVPKACAFCGQDHGGDGHPFEKWDEEVHRAPAPALRITKSSLVEHGDLK